MMKSLLIPLFLSIFLLSCGGGTGGLSPSQNLPVGEPSPIVRGLYESVSATCAATNGDLTIVQDATFLWFRGGLDQEFFGVIDSDHIVHFEIQNDAGSSECTARLIEPMFEGTCSSFDLICNFSFRRKGTNGEEKQAPVGDANPAPALSDRDQDRVPDESDNCPDKPNPMLVDIRFFSGYRQSDIDGDGLGDTCDSDIDGDGTPNESDDSNCAFLGQCKESALRDSDFDGVNDLEDNCQETSNPDQADSNYDSVGDACAGNGSDGDFDSDGDGILDSFDNCVGTRNPDQVDTNGDGQGDACVVYFKAYDPCEKRACPPEGEDPETEEDRRYSLPPR